MDGWPDFLGPVSEVTWEEFVFAMLVSLAASVIIWALYVAFYRDWERGAGIHRVFILAGPAITALFISIQFSLPLSLGLLGALSFVRFRTPIKDPAEIGYLLLVIGSSIAAATYNYELIGVLLGIAAVVLALQWLFSRTSLSGILPGGRDLIVTMPAGDYAQHERELLRFLESNLRGVKTESATQNADTASLHLRFRRSNFGERWGEFQSALNEAIAPGRAELYVG